MKQIFSKLTRWLAALILLLSQGAAAVAQTYDARGFYGSEPTEYGGGMAKFSSTSGQFSILKMYYEGDAALGMSIGGWAGSNAVYNGDKHYLVSVTGQKIVPISIETGLVDQSGIVTLPKKATIWAWTYDYEDERIYACVNKDNAISLYYLDPNDKTYTFEKVDNCIQFTAMAAAPDGNLYAIALSDGALYRVNKYTAQTTRIGATGIQPNRTNAGCAAINWNTGRMYWQNVGEDFSEGHMYEVNLASAKATQLWAYDEWAMMLGFDFPYQHTAQTKLPPSVATNLGSSFTNGSLTGNITFKAPTTTLDGKTQTSGSLTYTVKLNGVQAATGTTTYGQNVSAAVTAPAVGNYNVSITFRNEAGEGSPAEMTLWIGPDQPKAPTNVALRWQNNAFVLTWQAPTEGVHGGFFNASNLTYTVRRYGNGEVVALDLTSKTYTDPLGAQTTPQQYYYTVTAVQKGQESAPAQSTKVFAGSYDVTYYADFNDEERGLAGFTIVDGGDEDYTWEWNNGTALIRTYGHKAADDWLITPPIHLEAGVEYFFRLDASCGGSGANADERMAVCYGTENTAEAMTQTLIPVTKVDHNVMKSYNKLFTVATTGDYCFGVHCTSDIHYHLRVDNLIVRRADEPQKTAAPTLLSILTDPEGANKATIKVKTPETDMFGDPMMTSVDRVNVYRYRSGTDYSTRQLIGSKTAAQPGEVFEVVDEVPTPDYYVYLSSCSNIAGVSEEVRDTCFVGVNTPAAVQKLTVAEGATYGEALLSWEAPTQDVDGKDINSALICYDLYDANNQIVVEGHKETSYRYMAVADDEEQKYCTYSIVARTEHGESEPTRSGSIPLGKPLECPYYESFARGTLTHSFAATIEQGAGGFTVMMDEEGISSQDGDNGLLCIEGTPSFELDNIDVIGLYSTKINLPAEGDMGLSFYFKGKGFGSTNSIRVYIAEWNSALGFLEVTSNPLTTNVSNNWEHVVIPLSEYRGKTIRFKIEVENHTDRFTHIDNISIEPMKQHDLTVYNFAAPETMRMGETMAATMMVQNLGWDDANGWSVELLRNGEAVGTQVGINLTPGQLCIVYLYDVPGVTEVGDVTYSARVVWDKDEKVENNTSEEDVVAVRYSDWVRVKALEGALDGDEAYKLTWSAPEGEADEQVTEDFESYAPWSKNAIGEWGVVDYDGLNIAGLTNVNIPIAGAPASFFIFDFNTIENEAERHSYSGTQCAATMGSTKGDCEDWLISPILSGDAQTISFQARAAFWYLSGMNFEILYSTSAQRDITTFRSLDSGNTVSTDWTEYKFDLPKGTKYFAIVVYTSQFDGGLFFVDDITYVSAKNSVSDLLGYNIYRDNTFLQFVEAGTTTYTDTELGDKEAGHTYFVTAKYEKGESAPSPEVSFGLVDVKNLLAPASFENYRMYDLQGRRIKQLQKGVNIVNGRKVIK